ncbi:MAG TPA: hypothetical protein DCO75_12305, partial [Fibrobacteres bacterium]|nr:hypothetical protein [Fibrobacterota bacterium]
MKTRAIIIMLTAALSLGIVTNCTKNPIAGNGTQTGNPTVASMLYNPGGSPAKHAKVVFYPV